jgi:putative ABC transport system permease protein
MAVTIACLGLLGMVIYTTKNRCKEISIRRVLGAAVGEVMIEVSKEFLFLLMWSVLIGLPVGFFVARQFLQQYAYRIPVDIVILSSCAGSLLVLGSLTIAWHTYRAALSNPAARLRSE